MGRLISNIIFRARKPSQWGVRRPMCRLVLDQWTAYVALPTAVSVAKTDLHRLSYAATPCVSSCCCCCCVPRLNNVGVTRYVQFTLTNAFPTLRGWCVTGFCLLFLLLNLYFYLFYLHFLYYPATQAATGHLRRICSPFWREDAVTRGVNRG